MDRVHGQRAGGADLLVELEVDAVAERGQRLGELLRGLLDRDVLAADVTPFASLEPSRTGEPATQTAEAWALASRKPNVVVPAPGGSWAERFSTRPMAPMAWRAAISSAGEATVVADDV